MQRYDLGQPFFVSGPSTFFRATNRLLGSEVVMRRLEVDRERAAEQRDTFFREQRHVASLRHPYIQKTLDVFEEDGALWSVHPYTPIRITDRVVAERGPYAVADAARLAAHVADALSYLHERGFVHGRVTPAFILVAEHGDAILANWVKSSELAAGVWPLRPAVLGLGPFSAPEECAGEKPTPASDLFGLAATFLYWVTGSTNDVEGLVRTFCESGDATADALVIAGRVPQLSRVLAEALGAALQPDPARRRGSAAALAALFSEMHTRHAAEVPTGFETGSVLTAKGLDEPIELTGRIGAGRYGVVLRARSPSLGNSLAVKALKPEHRDDTVVVERFLREARALKRIRHDHVVRVLGVGEAREVPFLVMEFLDGPTLASHVRRNGMLGAAGVARLAIGLARGLGAIHDAALLHRDLKPDNVVLVGGERPVITDLGVAKALREEALTMSGALVGTPLYMAPEQAAGRETTQATDLYSLGAILYECLGGVPPHRANDVMALIVAVGTHTPEPLPADVPRALSDLVFRLLQKDPAKRPQDAAEVAAEIETIAAGLKS